MIRNNIHIIIFLLILLAAGALRLVAISADPPASLSQDFITDEAWWAHNARNHVLFGKWILDDFNQGLFAAPLHTALVWICFMSAGVSLEATRVVSALSGLMTIALLGVLLARKMDRWSGLAGMGILALDYFTISYDRVGFVEPLPACLMTLAACLVMTSRHRTFALFCAGVASVLSFMAKASAVFFLAVPVVFVLLGPRSGCSGHRDPINRMTVIKKLAAYLAGVVVCWAAWFVTLILPNWNEYVFQNGRLFHETRNEGFSTLIAVFTFGLTIGRGTAGYSGLLTQAVLPVGLASLWAIHKGLMVRRRGLLVEARELSELERFALLWIAMFLPHFVLNSNPQDRRYYSFVVPLVILGVQALCPRRREIIAFEWNRPSQRSFLTMAAGGIMVGLPPVLYLRLPIIRAIGPWTATVRLGATPRLSFPLVAALATGVASVGVYAVLRLAAAALPELRCPVGKVAAVIVALGLPFQMITIAGDTSRLSFTLRDTSRQVRKLLGGQARVIDGSALVFGTRCRSLILLDRRWAGYSYFGKAYVPSFGPTHLFISGKRTATEFDQEARQLLFGWGRFVPGSLQVFQYCPDGRGGMRFTSCLGKVEAIASQDPPDRAQESSPP